MHAHICRYVLLCMHIYAGMCSYACTHMQVCTRHRRPNHSCTLEELATRPHCLRVHEARCGTYACGHLFMWAPMHVCTHTCVYLCMCVRVYLAEVWASHPHPHPHYSVYSVPSTRTEANSVPSHSLTDEAPGPHAGPPRRASTLGIHAGHPRRAALRLIPLMLFRDAPCSHHPLCALH